jgi:hypothetical protein
LKEAILKTKPFVLTCLLFFGLLNLFIVVLDHYYFRTVALDYAVYNFAFYDYAHFRISPCPIYLTWPFSFLQDHFSLTLILLSPLYWLFSPIFGTYAVLIIQWFFIMTGAIFTYRLITLKSGNYFFGLGAMVYYFLLFGRYSAYREDANLAIMGSAIIPVFLYFFDVGKRLPLLLIYLFLLINREDYSLWLAFISLFLVVVYWRDLPKRNLAFILFICSSLVFILIMRVIIPALEDENKKYNLFDFTVVGKTPAEAFMFIISHPLDAIKFLFVNHSGDSYRDGIKQDFYQVYLLSGGILLLLRPWYLIPFIPILCKKMYDDNPLRWSTETFYSIEFVSIMPVLVFLIICSVIKKHNLRLVIAGFVCILTLLVTVYKMQVPLPNPILGESNKYNVVSSEFYKAPVDVDGLNRMLSLIPDDAAVSGTGLIIPHLAYREKVYYFPNVRDAEYLVLFKEGDYYPVSKEVFEAKVAEIRSQPDWQQIHETREVVLFKRRSKVISQARGGYKKGRAFRDNKLFLGF